jgi:acetyltransferase
MTAIAEPAAVLSRDGARLVIRPIRASDRSRLAAHFRHLSAPSRYRRFLNAKQQLTAEELTDLTVIDHHDQEALVALDDGGELVGVARYFRLRDRLGVAEVAVAVADHWQHRGVGLTLLTRLAGRAAEDGIDTFVASCLADNREMIALFHDVGVSVKRTGRGAGVVELEISLPGSGAR